MNRNIETIVAAHRIARERINEGKPSWAHRVDIQQFIDEDRRNDSEEHAAKVSNNIARYLKAMLPAAWFDVTHADMDWTLDEIVEDLASMTATSFDDGYTVLENFRGRLEELYNWADNKRVWLKG